MLDEEVTLEAPTRDRLWGKKPGTYFLPGLARLREERGYSVRKLAERAKMSPDTVSRLENMQRGAEPETRRKLSIALKTSIKELRTPDEEVGEG